MFYIIRFISALLHKIICSFNSQMMEFLIQSNSPHCRAMLIMDTQAQRKNCDSWHSVAHRRNDTCFSALGWIIYQKFIWSGLFSFVCISPSSTELIKVSLYILAIEFREPKKMKYKKKSHGFVHVSSMQRGKKGRKQSYLLCSDFLPPLWEEGVEEQ